MTRSIVGVLAVYLAGLVTARMIDAPANQAPGDAQLRLGNFSVRGRLKHDCADSLRTTNSPLEFPPYWVTHACHFSRLNYRSRVSLPTIANRVADSSNSGAYTKNGTPGLKALAK